ncbi:cytochrome b/b6 domain-containing protein [Sphingobacterium rhinopitheci]|uniref:cytochrome b/b6 domain-containing protein n=1 Tax=Sphingobacterium rhinopitheci TaxID=2781960 RepID=UPI001F52A3B3|nr:cytochrome b/b6 domain-containing protein [Sphingobacterium rhinopitheci]MCI0921104.1 cytochrome b/b6 domain-containing protein [Sphingobacterium rhinopitheci]
MKKYSLPHRVLHFIIGVSMLGLFITGFLRMNWMNRNNLANIIESQESTNHLQIPKESLNAIGQQLLAPMWQWHIIFAYSILLFFTLRIVYMITQGIRFPNPFNHRLTWKEKFQGIVYILFYALVFIDIITGFYMMWGGGTYKSLVEPIHKYSLYWFPIFFGLHIIGIVIGELTNESGIVSKMINGKEK